MRVGAYSFVVDQTIPSLAPWIMIPPLLACRRHTLAAYRNVVLLGINPSSRVELTATA